MGERLRNRSEVAAHAQRPQTLPTVARVDIPALGPNAETVVPVTLAAGAVDLPRPYGVLPLTVTVSGLTGATPVASFLPYHVIKEYEPLQLAVALPITADPDPVLLTGTPAERTKALARMFEAGSRIDRTLRVADATGATLVVDPGLLPPPPPSTGQSAPSGPAGASPTPTASAPTATGTTAGDPRAEFARRLAALDQDVWFVPPGDPDVFALASASQTASLPTLPPAPRTLPGTDRRTPTVSWPAGSASSQVRRAVVAASDPAPSAILMQETRTDPDPDRTGGASRRDDQGHRILVVDDRMSGLLGSTTGARTQQLLADSVTLLAESPGLSRSVLLLPGRGVDPAGLDASLQALRSAPWIAPVSGETVLATPPGPTPIVEATTPPQGPASPLTASNDDQVLELARLADGLRPSLGAGDVVPEHIGEILTSTRWRGHGPAWRAAYDRLDRRIHDLSQGVHVVPSMINFFAEHGALQVTVVNDLDVEVRDVRLLTQVQGRPSRLVIHSAPPTLTIRPHSRATVRLDVEALAAGTVPITASLRTASGTPLGEDATVRVRVQPTNGWILLAAGGIVGLVFVFGLFRALRAGERRVAAADLRGLDLR